MIILDANVIIGFLDADDTHHSRALRILEDHADQGYAASVLTVAETLVHPAMSAQDDRAVAALREIGLDTLPLSNEDASPLARVRARYKLRMPDAVVLYTALTSGGSLATFDSELASAARTAGITVIGQPPTG